MLEIIIYIVFSLLVILACVAVYVDNQRKIETKKNQRAVSERIEIIKSHYKGDLKRLVEQEALSIRQYDLVYRIANNFFVFQPVTLKSIAVFEFLLKKVAGVLENSKSQGNEAFEKTSEQINLFLVKLPSTGKGYNLNFYYTELPRLIKGLAAAKSKIDCSDNGFIEDETGNGNVSSDNSYNESFSS